MKVGIIGSGDVAKALGAGFLKHGHEVMLGSRTAGKLETWLKENSKAKAGSFVDAAKFGDLLVLAVKGSAALEALKIAGVSNVSGKTVIDATNPIADSQPENGVLRFFSSLDTSLMERLQKEFKDAKFVKAFNSVGNALMVDPKFKEGRPSMFICGNDEGSKKTVGRILDDFGWEVEDMGKAEAARAIEPLCMLWCIPGLLRNDWVHAFRLLKG